MLDLKGFAFSFIFFFTSRVSTAQNALKLVLQSVHALYTNIYIYIHAMYASYFGRPETEKETASAR